MKQGNLLTQIKESFREDSKFKVFLLSIVITGLSYGLYKGMIDNFLAEIVGMGEMDRGVSEFFRELPGVLLVFIRAAFYMLSAETMYKAGALIMLVGMAMHAVQRSAVHRILRDRSRIGRSQCDLLHAGDRKQ